MSQLILKANLLSIDVIPCTRFAGRDVIVPGQDQKNTAGVMGTASKNIGSPEVYYIHNVMPTSEGMKSIGFRTVKKSANITIGTRSITAVSLTTGTPFVPSVGTTYPSNILNSTAALPSVKIAPTYTSACVVKSGLIITSPSGSVGDNFGLYDTVNSRLLAYIQIDSITTTSSGAIFGIIVSAYVYGKTAPVATMYVTTVGVSPLTTDMFEIEYIGSTVVFSFNGIIKYIATVSDSSSIVAGLTVQSSFKWTFNVYSPFTNIVYGQYSVLATTPVFDMAQIIELRDNKGNYGHLGITLAGKAYISTNTNIAWAALTGGAAIWKANDVTKAYASGVTYLCNPLDSLYTINLLTGVATVPTLTLNTSGVSPIVMNTIVGIVGSYNYLIMHNGQSVLWSSALNPLDFNPSLVTGAGSAIPTSLGALILVMHPINLGFAIYTGTNIVIVAFSGNSQYPWIFKPAYNSAGITKVSDVSVSGEDGTNYAWTSAGILQVSATGTAQVYSDIADYLSSRLLEDFSYVTNTLTLSYLTSDILTKITYANSRFVCISYGVTTLTHCFIYDIALKRWGKVRIPHVAVLGYTGAPEAVASTDYYYPSTASTHKLMSFLQLDGSIVNMVFSYGDTNHSAVLILGKFQVTRTKVFTLQGVSVDNVDAANTANFSIQIQTSMDGKSITDKITNPVLISSGALTRSYGCRVTGVNHSVVVSGAFDLVDVILTITTHGSR